MSPELQLQLHDAHPYTLGETIRGNVVLLEGGRSRSLEVELRYIEKTKDYSKATTISSATLHEGDLTKATLFEFEVLPPEDGTPDYRTNHSELYWELGVRSVSWVSTPTRVAASKSARNRARLRARQKSWAVVRTV